MRAAAALAALALAGCFDTHDRDDAGVLIDGEMLLDTSSDRADAWCPTLGSHRVCGAACPDPCPRETAAACNAAFGVCTPNPVPDGQPRSGRLGGTAREYCYDAGPMAMPEARWDPEMRSSGLCLGEAYCREAIAAGVDVVCVWSDESFFETGPPADDRCPVAPHELTPFCGGACPADGCPYHPDFFAGDWHISCVGVSETRGLGMCAFGTPSGCGEGEPNYATQCMPFYGQPCACLRLRQPGGALDERGFVTFASSCTAYRALYPEDVECTEPFAWTALP